MSDAVFIVLSKLTMMKIHYDVISKNFENIKNIIYFDTDCFAYNIKHDEIYELMKQIREYFDLSDSVSDHMGDNTHEKGLEKLKTKRKITDSCFHCPES